MSRHKRNNMQDEPAPSLSDDTISAYTESIGSALHFVREYEACNCLYEITRGMNTPTVLMLDTRVVNELEEIQQENRQGNTIENQCLEERATKVLKFYRSAASLQFMPPVERPRLIADQQSRSRLVTIKSIPKICAQVSLSIAAKPVIHSNKVEPTSGRRPPVSPPRNILSLSQKSKTIDRSDSSHNISTQTDHLARTTTVQTATNHPQISKSPLNSRIHEPAISRVHRQEDCKQNNSLSINENYDSRQNIQSANAPSLSQTRCSRQRPHLNFASGTLINIHEVLRARKESRSHDSDKTKKMDDFKARIETEMDVINRQLKTLKEKKSGKDCDHLKPKGDTDTDERIEELQQEIRRISLQAKDRKTPRDLETVTLKLDISAQCIQDQRKSLRSRGPRIVTTNLSRSRTKTPRGSVRPSAVTQKQSRAIAQREVSKDNEKKMYSRRRIQTETSSYTSVTKTFMNEKQMERKSIERLKQSMNYVTREKKPLLSTRITQISKRSGDT